ncbi:MAG: hypothetical protein IJ396_00470 [Oscillibacter sp.]|nr:hypothetical protein [Oscillibacter sp.]
MELKIIHFYPDLMSLYGSYANVAVLKRYLEALGNTVTVEAVAHGTTADLSGADFLFMGAGTERRQKTALADFAQYGEAVKAAAEDGCPQLYAGTAMELLGKTVTDADGKEYAGIGLGSFTAVQSAKRLVGDVYGESDFVDAPVVGFMNKSSVISGVETPLLRTLQMGIGNEGEKTAEGFRFKNVIGSHLTGPLLAKNPRLLEMMVRGIYARRGVKLPVELPVFSHAEEGYAVTAEQLKLRWQTAETANK